MRHFLSGVLLLALTSTSALACSNNTNFDEWLQGFKTEAASAGVKPALLDQVLSGMKPDPAIIQRDRSQQSFAMDFITFANKKISPGRLAKGRSLLQLNAGLFKRIENDFGVDPAVLTAFWGLETDFGAVTGDYPILNALVTLAYDCRRPEKFRPELIHALMLVQKGDLTPSQMRGAWAGELGQLQLLASRYDEHAIDYDGDGHRNLIKSKADALASAAVMLKEAGWRAGEPWLQEVKVPAQMDWAQARLDNKQPITTWAAQGVTNAHGGALKGSGSAALLLPMGRNGPAFLAYPNFDVFLAWNDSTVYSLTAAYFAARLAGAAPMRLGNGPVHALTMSQTKQLQAKLQAKGFAITKVDGMIGEETRSAVRKVQQELNLPADGYPDNALLARF